MLKVNYLIADADCEFSRKKQTICAIVSREGFPDQRIALSKLNEALRLIVPLRKASTPKVQPSKAKLVDGGRDAEN